MEPHWILMVPAVWLCSLDQECLNGIFYLQKCQFQFWALIFSIIIIIIVFLTGSCLLDASTLEPIPAIFSTPNSKSQLYTALLSTPEEFFDLIAEYPDAVSSKGFSSTVSKHPARHNVPTFPGPPVLAEKLESARKEFAAY